MFLLKSLQNSTEVLEPLFSFKMKLQVVTLSYFFAVLVTASPSPRLYDISISIDDNKDHPHPGHCYKMCAPEKTTCPEPTVKQLQNS